MVRPTKMLVLTDFGTKKSWSKTYESEKMFVQINLVPNKCAYKQVLGPTKYGSTKMVVPQRIVVPQKLGSTKMLGLQKDWVLIKCGPKHLDPNKCWVL